MDDRSGEPGWKIGSFGLVAGGLAPTALGGALVVAQAIVVAILAELEYVGLRTLTAAQAG